MWGIFNSKHALESISICAHTSTWSDPGRVKALFCISIESLGKSKTAVLCCILQLLLQLVGKHAHGCVCHHHSPAVTSTWPFIPQRPSDSRLTEDPFWFASFMHSLVDNLLAFSLVHKLLVFSTEFVSFISSYSEKFASLFTSAQFATFFFTNAMFATFTASLVQNLLILCIN